MKVTYGEGVFEELVNLSVYLADVDESLAHAFLDACDATFQFLASNKFIGSVREFGSKELIAIRMWRVKAFEKYLIFYVPTETGIKVLHVLHSSIDYNRFFEGD
jgi:toxin ParE1/3/4